MASPSARVTVAVHDGEDPLVRAERAIWTKCFGGRDDRAVWELGAFFLRCPEGRCSYVGCGHWCPDAVPPLPTRDDDGPARDLTSAFGPMRVGELRQRTARRCSPRHLDDEDLALLTQDKLVRRWGGRITASC